MTTMTLKDLPAEIQDYLNTQRATLHETMKTDTPYHVCFVNKEGTRYFEAVRKSECWNDDKGHYMPFGGGSHWCVKYGKVLWDRKKQPLGNGYDYFWVLSNKTFCKAANGTVIIPICDKKAEVLEMAKKIGIFEIN